MFDRVAPGVDDARVRQGEVDKPDETEVAWHLVGNARHPGRNDLDSLQVALPELTQALLR